MLPCISDVLASFDPDSQFGLRLSESKEKELFEELPLCIIQQRYAHLPDGGAEFVKELKQSRCLS